jgi:hypothetical protein
VETNHNSQAHGTQYTQKMEGMVKDLTMARDETARFNKYRERNGITTSADLSITLLTHGGCWFGSIHFIQTSTEIWRKKKGKRKK